MSGSIVGFWGALSEKNEGQRNLFVLRDVSFPDTINLSKTFFLTNGLSNCQKRPTIVGRFVFEEIRRSSNLTGSTVFNMTCNEP